MSESHEKWSNEYDSLINNPPKEGAILTTLEADAKVLLAVDLQEGSPPFIFGRAFVPEIVGAQVGWFAQSTASHNFHGWKCIMMPRARTELIRRFGLKNDTMEVASLRVIRMSKSGKSLLCEVNEYGDVPNPEVPDPVDAVTDLNMSKPEVSIVNHEDDPKVRQDAVIAEVPDLNMSDLATPKVTTLRLAGTEAEVDVSIEEKE